ncbi:MAG: hypothetical protein LDL50_00115, partial [Chloroflexi bacterium]|nr:hypothetical protein [Chloroflexota bacterium]
MLRGVFRGLELTFILFILALALGNGVPSSADEGERARAYTRQIEFDYLSWMANAAFVKMRAASIGAPHIFSPAAQKQIVFEYLAATRQTLEKEYRLEQLYADAGIENKELASQALRAELNALYARQRELAPLAEAVAQGQISQILAEVGLTVGGQPVPEVLYRVTPLPKALIISPRSRIEQTANVSIEAELTLDEIAALE